MQLSQIPTQVPLPFAANGTKNAIPEASQIGVTPGAASLNDGFPPLTFTPLAAGGVPPSGADFNGILNLLSQNTQWQNAGGFFPYSASFSTAIGGYPKTALLAKASGLGFWLNLEDNNESDPDTGGAGWIAFDPWAIQAGQFTTAKDTGAANAYAIALTPTPAALTPGMMVGIQSVGNTNTGAATLAVNGLSTLPILLGKGTALIGGELVAGYGALLRLNYAGTAWELIWTGAGEFVPPATQSNAATQLSQLFIGNRKAVFTANGNYTVPDYISTIWVSGCGGGGGGGGGSSVGGGGGNSGEYILKTPISVTPGDTLQITIGAGGANGGTTTTTGNGAAGGTGGNTILQDENSGSILLTLYGGIGGSGGDYSSNNNNSANAVNPATNNTQPGWNGLYINGYTICGAGASSIFGTGGCGAFGVAFGSSQDAFGYGAGGGGGGSTLAGGNGTPGILIIEW